ncbi:hypothetical protein ACIRNY_09385 [Capnocytophaga canimorsus]|uniref:hypothetical protein n=1 Tax=Capnocytophaga canimorsus TaxID=28188 RepID=UPI00384FCA82
MKKIDDYNEIVTQLELLDYSEINTIYECITDTSQYSWELSLIIVVNVFIKNPDIALDEISENMLLMIGYESTRSTYQYIKSKYYNENTNLFVKENMKMLMEIIENKYLKMGITLR